jgi:hypothetical protein
VPTTCICKTVCMLHDLWAWHPPVGVYIGILGFLGVLAALIRDPTKIGRREKAAWVFVMFTLLLLEIKSVYQDRNEHDKEQAEARRRETDSFATIAEGINHTIEMSAQQFDATMKRSDSVISLQRQSLNDLAGTVKTLTGDESYAYLGFVPGQGFLAFPHMGKYPLYGVSARIVDLDNAKSNPFGVTISVGDMIQGHANTYSVPANFAPSGDHVNLNVFFTARNGDWVQILRETRVGNAWLRAIQVRGRFSSLRKEKVMCETIDAQFPRDTKGEIDGFLPPSSPKLPLCQ